MSFSDTKFSRSKLDFYYKNVVIRKSASRFINTCSVANQKFSDLCRIWNYINSDKCKLIVNAFVKSQFSDYPPIWMFCTQESNFRGYRVHEYFKITLEDYISSFSGLVTLLKEKTFHQRCINFLMTEGFKYLNGLSPDLMNEVFRLKSNYHNLRNFNQFVTYIPKTKSICVSIEHVSIEQINCGRQYRTK